MSPDLKWTPEALYSKAVLFASYARAVGSDSPVFGLWSSLSIELLARAALAKIHPSLLADPRDHENILYGFGVPTQREPLSIPARTVFGRCRVLVGGFDEAAEVHCQLLTGIRNRELHTGEAAFESLTHNRWMADHYRAVTILTNHLGADLSDFYKPEAAEALQEILDNRTKEVEARAKQAVGNCRKWYQSLASTKQQELIEAARAAEGLMQEPYWVRQACPSCGNPGVLSGNAVENIQTHLAGDELISRYSILSNSFKCNVCQLNLSTHDEIFYAGLPATFEVTRTVDPLEHFGINPTDYLEIDEMSRILERQGLHVVEPDYGNE